MPTTELSGWQSSFKSLPCVSSVATGVQNIADWIDAQVTGKLAPDPDTLSKGTYTWQKSLFIATLSTAVPSSDPSAITKIADAWEAATTASILIVPSGTYTGSPSPATTFSAPPTVVILPSSVTAAKSAMIASLLGCQPTADPDQVKLPEIIRTAFLAIKFSATGVDSVPPPTGPQTLSVASVPMK